MPDPWKIKDIRTVAECRVFDLKRILSIHPKKLTEHEFHVLHANDWVNICAVTPRNTMVFVKQWRQGIQKPSLEIPGGIVDSGENLLESAKRELLEETGYTSSVWTSLGSVAGNPAMLNNTCHTFLALNATKTSETDFDETEDLDVLEIPLDEIHNHILSGEIIHGMVVAALYFFFHEAKHQSELGWTK